MDEKINLQAVDNYSDQFATKVISQAFANKEKIAGPEILQLCDIRQVNLFVVRELMHAWKLETQKLKSPYFNYQSQEVVKALEQFQIVLSNHIQISRHDFHPLLRRAVSNTLFVVLGPYDFYAEALDPQGQTFINVADLKSDIKYLRVNKQPLDKLVQKLEEKKLTTISGNEAFALLDSILEEVNFTPEEIDPFINDFSKTVHLDLQRLYEQKAVNRPKAAAVAAPKNEIPKNALPEKPKATPNHFHKVNQIKDSLTINQKFMFTKILFKGDFEIFSHAIDELDGFESLTQAMEYVESHHPEWDRESDEFLEFREMLEKRFA
jgi:hypothetical protein